MFENIWIPVSVIGGIALLFGLGLAYASHKFRVDVDERVAKIREILPGANCGACGQTGCDAYAEAVVEGEVSLSACPVGGSELTAKLCDFMGLEAEKSEKKVARVMCSGTYDNCVQKYNYSGIEDCNAAAAF